MAGTSTPITNAIKFEKTQEYLNPSAGLYPLTSITSPKKKHVSVPAEVYTPPNFADPILRAGTSIIPVSVWQILHSLYKELHCITYFIPFWS